MPTTAHEGSGTHDFGQNLRRLEAGGSSLGNPGREENGHADALANPAVRPQTTEVSRVDDADIPADAFLPELRTPPGYFRGPLTGESGLVPPREAKGPTIIHMARTGAKGTFCGRSADPTNSIDPYVSEPRVQDRWCKACYATTALVAHVAPVSYGDGYSDEPQTHVIRFGRPPV